MNPAFYNTNKTDDQTMLQFTVEALTQEDKVLEVFNLENKPLAWWEVKGHLHDMNEVSPKRAMTNLYKRGRICKTTDVVMGIYGKQTHKYKLV